MGAVEESLRRAAGIGSFFAPQPRTADFIPWRAIISDPSVLREQVDRVRESIAARASVRSHELDERACASTYFLAVVARVVAPSLATAVLDGVVLRLTPETVWVHGTSVALEPAEAGDDLYVDVIEAVVEPLEQATARAFRMSHQVLWGDVASALASAARMIDVAAARAGRAAVDALLTKGNLVGAGGYAGAHFVRNNCCLYYRLPGGGLCGDCVLSPRPVEFSP